MNPPTPTGRSPDTNDESAPQRESIEQRLAERHGGARVLIVEDDVYGQEILAEYVRIGGLTADLAGDGVEALERAGRAQYDLVLMDVQMPRMDGLDATRRLRQRPEYAETPIIAVTAHAYAVAEQMSRQAGMDAFLTKPLDPAILYATLLEWLDRQALVGTSA